MNVRLLQKAVGLAFAGLIVMTAGCSSDDDETDDMTTPDTGIKDTGPNFPDSGEGGQDAAPRDMGPRDMGTNACPDGTEGCACASSLTEIAADTVFVQDNCASGLLCVPWDLVTGRDQDVTMPVHSCVDPCTSDAECGAGRFCAGTSMGSGSGAGRVCVDQLSDVDEYCHLSKGTVSRLPTVTLELPGVLAGCADGRLCSPGGASSLEGTALVGFTDVHPDNGICMATCTSGADCTQAEFAYCNPRFGSTTSTAFVGICSLQQLDQIGSFCGAIAPHNVGSTGLSNGCDAAAGLACLGVDGLFPAGSGFCGQFCSDTEVCTAMEPGGELYVCHAAPGNNPMGDGLCVFEGASSFPDSCNGDGGYDFGRQELTLVYGGEMGNPNDDVPLPLCVDRLGPPLDFALLTPDATMLFRDGPPCDDPADEFSWAKCIEPSSCQNLAANVNRCVVGCTRTTTTAAGPQGGCAPVSTTSSCAPAFVDMMGNPVDIGICGDM